jgi:hypothetical protein
MVAFTNAVDDGLLFWSTEAVDVFFSIDEEALIGI